jgi:hypothetical protein
MKRDKSVMITVITTAISSKKVFIEGLSRRSWDGRYLITNHTENPEDAREFLDAEHAEKTISNLVNHHSRHYSIEQILVPVSKRHSLMDEDELT